ncbi:MAG: DUF2244 domain-containing protein [Pseudomonadota bacterium]
MFANSAEGPPVFQAVLYPNRSLGGKGFTILMGAIIAVGVLVGGAFALAGAWPVSGFLGLDVFLLYLAFRWSFRDSSRADFIRVDACGLNVRRVLPNGKSKEWRFETAWVQVILENRRLLIRSHGNELAIGAFLTQQERASLADALNGALRAQREAPARA